MHAFSKKLLLNIFLLYELSDGFRTKECKAQEMENGALAISTAMVLCSIFWWITNSFDQGRVWAVLHAMQLHDTLGLEYTTGMV